MSVAFKEWEVICDALASGRQTILLRKGGIHEGRDGFSFAHKSFYLFPTKFHAQNDHVRDMDFTPGAEWKVGDEFSITHHAEAILAMTLKNWSQVEQLFPHHIYKSETLQERFDWQGKGMDAGSIHVALVKVRRLASPVRLTYEKKFGGCRSWVEVPIQDSEIPLGSVPVLDEKVFEEVRSGIESLVGGLS